MSATGRGTERNKDDAYYTPKWLIDCFLPHVINRQNFPGVEKISILEPAAGNLGLVSATKEYLTHCNIDHRLISIDLTNMAATYTEDFLTTPPEPTFDVIITNPPYSKAFEFVQHAMKFRKNENSIVAFLLRLNWLGSLKRSSWLKNNVPTVYVTPKRPSFVNTGKSRSDACEYGWFVWEKEPKPLTFLNHHDTWQNDKNVVFLEP